MPGYGMGYGKKAMNGKKKKKPMMQKNEQEPVGAANNDSRDKCDCRWC